jgi:hypothetical protein
MSDATTNMVDRLIGAVTVCPCCAAPGRLKLDRHGRPFQRCTLCGLLVFLKTGTALAGWARLAAHVRANRAPWRVAVERDLAAGLDDQYGVGAHGALETAVPVVVPAPAPPLPVVPTDRKEGTASWRT